MIDEYRAIDDGYTDTERNKTSDKESICRCEQLYDGDNPFVVENIRAVGCVTFLFDPRELVNNRTGVDAVNTIR